MNEEKTSLNLNETFRIRKSTDCLVLEQLQSKCWKVVGYYGSLKQLKKGIMNRVVMDDPTILTNIGVIQNYLDQLEDIKVS